MDLETSRDELDLPPEYCHYRDEGCDLADSCLHCPFPKCVYDQPGGRQRWLKRLRDREMVRLFTAEGKGVNELAGMFGVSQRTVQRAILKSFNATAYTATIQVTGSHTAYLEDIPVARNLPSAEMTASRRVGVLFFDEYNPKEAVVVAVYT